MFKKLKFILFVLKRNIFTFIKKSIDELPGNSSIIYEVLNYREHYFSTQKEKVIYTCITGGYDNLIQHSYINFDYDYICFTDNIKLLNFETYGVWKIRPLYYSELDNTKNSRWHKTNPHILFPKYEESIWVDSNIDIKSVYLFNCIDDDKNCKLKIPIHNFCKCIYSECTRVIKTKKEIKENVLKILKLLKNDGFPINYGLNETNIIYRKHNDMNIIAMMEQWWYFIKEYTKRDQLSFSYVLWKHHIKPDDISIKNVHSSRKHFTYQQHNKK